MGKKDTVEKTYLSDNARFADVVNYVLYKGEKVILPDDLVEQDTTETIVENIKGTLLDSQKWRDVLKRAVIKTCNGRRYVLLGIENQTDVHYAMPLKNLQYDVLNYADQANTIAKSHQNRASSDGAKENAGEFLSGFRKSDKLVPVITIVVYWGSDPWDAPRCFYDMLPDDLTDVEREYVPNYKIPLLVPAEIQSFEAFSTEVRLLAQVLQRGRNKEALIELFENNDDYRHVDPDTANAIQAFTKIRIDNSDGKEVNMCQAVEEWKEDLLNEGRQAGEQRGEERITKLVKALADSKQYSLERITQILADDEKKAQAMKEFGI